MEDQTRTGPVAVVARRTPPAPEPGNLPADLGTQAEQLARPVPGMPLVAGHRNLLAAESGTLAAVESGTLAAVPPGNLAAVELGSQAAVDDLGSQGMGHEAVVVGSQEPQLRTRPPRLEQALGHRIDLGCRNLELVAEQLAVAGGAVVVVVVVVERERALGQHRTGKVEAGILELGRRGRCDPSKSRSSDLGNERTLQQCRVGPALPSERRTQQNGQRPHRPSIGLPDQPPARRSTPSPPSAGAQTCGRTRATRTRSP